MDILETVMNLFGVKSARQLRLARRKNCKPALRYFYARDGKKNERVLSVVRRVDFDNSRIIYAWTMNDPRADRFVRREARRILNERLAKEPHVVVLQEGKRPIKTVMDALLTEENFPATAAKLLTRWSEGR